MRAPKRRRHQRKCKKLTLKGARAFCIAAHERRLQIYGNDENDNPSCQGHPFRYHLLMLEVLACAFGIKLRSLRVGILGHDLLEDTDVTIEVLRNEGFSLFEIALIHACTDGPGETAAHRKRAAYAKIRVTPGADIVKLIDRMGNVLNTLECGCIAKFESYRRAHRQFKKAVYRQDNAVAVPLWQFLDWLFSPEAYRLLSCTHKCRSQWRLPDEVRARIEELLKANGSK